jgi:hypothetical protein
MIDEGTAARYAELVRESAQHHRDALAKLPRDFHPVIVDRLRSSIERALDRGSKLTPQDVTFSYNDVANVDVLPAADARRLINPWGLGVGSSMAPIVVCGTEHAYGLEDAVERKNLALDGCGLSILWLSRSTSISNVICPHSLWATAEPYEEQPNDFYRVDLDPDLKTSHTWVKLSRILGLVWSQEPARFLQPRAEGFLRLGDVAYQIELSSVPAKQVADGEASTDSRIDFLCRILDALPARVLLLSGDDTANNAQREMIARSFLGLAQDAAVFTSSEDVTQLVVRRRRRQGRKSRPAKQMYWWSQNGPRIAVKFSPALGGAQAKVLRERVADLVRPYTARQQNG